MRHVPLKPAGPLWDVPLYERNRWERDHKGMYDRIKNMKSELDLTPPWHDERLMDNLKMAKKWYVANNGAEIARENKLLVDKLYNISKTSYLKQRALRRGETVPPPGVPMSTVVQEPKTGGKVHDALRNRNRGTIEADNEALVGRILSVKKTIDLKSFRDDFKQHLHLRELRSRIPKDMRGGPAKSPAAPKKERQPMRSASEGGTRGFLLGMEDLRPVGLAASAPALPPPLPDLEGAGKERSGPASAGDSRGPGAVAPSPMVFVRSLPARDDEAALA